MPAQQSPNLARSFKGFPEAVLEQGSEVYRSHAIRHGAGFYASGEGGRFNLEPPRGTLYVATDLDTAVREKVRDAVVTTGVVSRRFAAAFEVAILSAPETTRAADVADRAASRYGVTRELGTMDDYTITRAWASAFDSFGYGGIRYGSRFTTGPANAWAIYGTAGEYPVEVLKRTTGVDACAQVGIRVADLIPGIGSITLS
ncbi:RES family NAD+ phosphorylase [Leifsonia shinshuensis]